MQFQLCCNPSLLIMPNFTLLTFLKNRINWKKISLSSAKHDFDLFFFILNFIQIIPLIVGPSTQELLL